MRPWVVGVAIAVGALLAILTAGVAHRRRRKRRGRAAFHEGLLTRTVAAGATGARGVRVWGRSPTSGRHKLRIEGMGSKADILSVHFDVPENRDDDGTWVVCYPGDFEGAAQLWPLTEYRYSVQHVPTGDRVGEGRFETAPSTPEQTPECFSLAALSCHLPFDSFGELSAQACRLLEVLPTCLEEHDVKRVVMMGDQIYGDYPKSCSLFDRDYFRSVAPPGRRDITDCSRREVRLLFQHRHRIFWKHKAFETLQSRFACHMILDDHEITDNFGTAPEHSSERFACVKAGALDAVYDYQMARTVPREAAERPDAFHHSFEYGTVAVFVTDLRSQRQATDSRVHVMDETQWDALERFLAGASDKHVVFLVTSVPVLHVPDWLATCGQKIGAADGDIADRWSNPKMRDSKDRLLKIIHGHQKAHPLQRVVLLAGDVHVGFASRLAWADGTRDSYQLISSALSNREGFLLRELLEVMPEVGPIQDGRDQWQYAGEGLDSVPLPLGRAPHNPFGRLNAGLVEVRRISESESTVRLMLVGCTDDGSPLAETVFDSGAL